MTATHTAYGEGWSLTLRSAHPDHQRVLDEFIDDDVAARLFSRDSTLWGVAAAEEADRRLAWVDLDSSSRPLVGEIARLRAEFAEAGLDRVVLCGMGGSSLAPEVICAAAGAPLVVLDSSHPDLVRAAVGTDIDRTVVVVSSKSGGTVETDSQRRVFEAAFRDAGIDPAERIVVVTDPGSPFDEAASALGYRVFRADPDVGGRYSALSAFGLVPSGLAGADVERLLDEAGSVRAVLAVDASDNPALQLGTLLGVAAGHGVDKLVLAPSDSPHPGLGDWTEQLVAESTGKEGTGLLPVVVRDLDDPNYAHPGPDSILTSYGERVPSSLPQAAWAAHLHAPLGAQFLIWEAATAVAGRVLGINPFDQPDVESAKAAARGMLDGEAPRPEPAFRSGSIEVYASPGLLPEGETSLRAALAQLFAAVPADQGYLAVEAYLDSTSDARLADVRASLARRLERPVTFGWGPRFLHSTGQYHKGGPATGVHLQVTSTPVEDVRVPDRPFTLGEFIEAQAIGDASVLMSRGRPVLRVHLDDDEALERLLETLALWEELG